MTTKCQDQVPAVTVASTGPTKKTVYNPTRLVVAVIAIAVVMGLICGATVISFIAPRGNGEGNNMRVEVTYNNKALDGDHGGRIVANGGSSANSTLDKEITVSVNFILSCAQTGACLPCNPDDDITTTSCEEAKTNCTDTMECKYVQQGCLQVQIPDDADGESIDCSDKGRQYKVLVGANGQAYAEDPLNTPDTVYMAIARYTGKFTVALAPANEGFAAPLLEVHNGRMDLGALKVNVQDIGVDKLRDEKEDVNMDEIEDDNAGDHNDMQWDHSDEARRQLGHSRSLESDITLDPSSPILQAGAFADSLDAAWRGGPHVKISGDFLHYSWGQSWYQPRANFVARNFELMMGTLPDLHLDAVVPPSSSEDPFKLDFVADFSRGGACKKAVDAAVGLEFNAKGCIGYLFGQWCYVRAHKKAHVTLNFSPVVKIEIGLSVSDSTSLNYNIAVKDIDLHGLAVEGIPDSPIFSGLLGWFGNWAYNKFAKDRVRDSIAKFKRDLPEKASKALTTAINDALPEPGTITGVDNANQIADLLSTIVPNGTYDLLVMELAKIPGLLVGVVPFPPMPASEQCSGFGLIETYDDRCMHDYGISASGDNHEVYCVAGHKYHCLSGELCPPRGETQEECAATFTLHNGCSSAGLRDNRMTKTWGQKYVYSHRSCRGRWWWRRCYNRYKCIGPRVSVTCSSSGVVEVSPSP